MATELSLSPAFSNATHRLSISTSSQSSPTSSTSSLTTPTFGLGLRIQRTSEEVRPKIEELDEDELGNAKEIPLALDGCSGRSPDGEVKPKRGRGRPRIHPKPSPGAPTKFPKGHHRSKTGCRTCRRRKKKCDEAKPECRHCQKNNLVCEGYEDKKPWQSGKDRLAKGRQNSVEVIPRGLPVLIEGIETDLDRLFFQHFNLVVSQVLTLNTELSNPMKEILLPMATSHRGLMHSLLCLSASHMLATEQKPEIEDRQNYHHQRALENLRTDEKLNASIGGDVSSIVDDATVASTVVMCLDNICVGHIDGSYRTYMDLLRHSLRSQQSQSQEFQNFFMEFFVYHDVSNSITATDRYNVLMMEDFQLPNFMHEQAPEAGSMLGVVDGLFGFISRTRKLRDQIRYRQSMNFRPVVDYNCYSEAQAIDTAIRNWVCTQPEGTHRYTASLLYQNCAWIYLHRTVLRRNEHLHAAVEEGLRLLRQLPTDEPTESILLMPLFLLGCSAFDPAQRPEIRERFDGLQAYSHRGNIRCAKEIVEVVWSMMDVGNENAWDWESIMMHKGWDLLIS